MSLESRTHNTSVGANVVCGSGIRSMQQKKLQIYEAMEGRKHPIFDFNAIFTKAMKNLLCHVLLTAALSECNIYYLSMAIDVRGMRAFNFVRVLMIVCTQLSSMIFKIFSLACHVVNRMCAVMVLPTSQWMNIQNKFTHQSSCLCSLYWYCIQW